MNVSQERIIGRGTKEKAVSRAWRMGTECGFWDYRGYAEAD